ncbi:glycosyltransferase [Winogradskyella sp.]|nr:glycosyltransferase [Winogradskyella sp.]
MSKITFSILMANYNNEKFIEEAVQSVKNQSYKFFELIIVDDCSTDGSKKLITSLQEKHSFIKSFFLTKNKGYGNALKVAAEKSNGVLLGILDPDDTIDTNALSIMYAEYLKNPDTALFYSTMFNCDKDLKVININQSIGPIPAAETYQSLINNVTSHISHFRVMPKKMYDKTEGFNPKFKKAIDKDIIYKLEEVGAVIYIDKPLYYYRQHDGSISLFKNKWEAALWEVKAKHKAYLRRKKNNTPSLTSVQLKNLYRNVYKELAIENLQQKKHLAFIKVLMSNLHISKSIKQTLKLGYYCMMKYKYPERFSVKNH